MGRVFPKYKYQSGGVIPRYEGAQVLGQPLAINQQVSPVEFNPSGALGGIRLDLYNRQEQRLSARDEFDKNRILREEIGDNLKMLNERFSAGLDMVTGLNMNDPNQVQLANNIIPKLTNAYDQGASILSNPTLSPEEKMQQFQKQAQGISSLFANKEYISATQRNAVTKKLYDELENTVTSDDYLIADNYDHDMDLLEAYNRGDIGLSQLNRGWKNVSVGYEEIEAEEDKFFGMLENMAKLGVANMPSEYRKDKDFLKYGVDLVNGGAGDYVDVAYNYYKDNPRIRAAASRRSGLDLENDEQLRKFAETQAMMATGSALVGDIGGRVRNTKSERRLTESERKERALVDELNTKGFDVISTTSLGKFETPVEVITAKGFYDDYVANPDTPIPKYNNLSINDINNIRGKVASGEELDPENKKHVAYSTLSNNGSLDELSANIQMATEADNAIKKTPESDIEGGARISSGVAPDLDSYSTDSELLPNFNRNRISYDGNSSTALGFLERTESANSANMVNPDDQGQASVGPHQYRGKAGQEYLEKLGITGYDLTKPLTKAQANELNQKIKSAPNFYEVSKEILNNSPDRVGAVKNYLEDEGLFDNFNIESLPEGYKLPFYSLAVNHSNGGKKKIIKMAKNKLSNPNNFTIDELAKAIQESRAEYVNSLTFDDSGTKDSLLERYSNELAWAINHPTNEVSPSPQGGDVGGDKNVNTQGSVWHMRLDALTAGQAN